MSVRIAHGFVMKYGLISPQTVEPGQKERVPLMVAVYALSRQVQLSDMFDEATSGVSMELGGIRFLCRGVWLRGGLAIRGLLRRPCPWTWVECYFVGMREG